jgi:hypothetical protein
MGLAAWLNLEGPDVVAFMISGLVGYFAGSLVPPGAWAVYTSILVSYHLFLGWLVFYGDREAAVSLPIMTTIVTHLACMAIVVPLGMARHYIPFFGILRYGIAGMAIFERWWMFSSESQMTQPKSAAAPLAPIVLAASADDFEAWRQHLARRKPGSQQAGASLKAEYEKWLLARHQSRVAQSAADGQQS